MKGYLHSLTLACAVVLMCAGCATAPVQRTAWEYKYINSSARSPREEELDALGKEGWELVAATDAGYFLKRPIQK